MDHPHIDRHAPRKQAFCSLAASTVLLAKVINLGELKAKKETALVSALLPFLSTALFDIELRV